MKFDLNDVLIVPETVSDIESRYRDVRTSYGSESYTELLPIIASPMDTVVGKENMEISGQKDIRWMVEDALKYSRKASRKEIKYNGIILDPPAFGHGPNGESWKLERDIDELLACVFEMLDPKEHFFIINTYSLGFSALILRNLLNYYKQADDSYEIGELVLNSTSNQILPLGVFARGFRQEK